MPLLPQAAKWLVGKSDRQLGLVDLSEYLVVVPVASARRRLLELLVVESGGRLLTPEIMTPAELPERLYRVKKPFASIFTQQMAWRAALQNIPADDLAHVVPNPPPLKAFRESLALADLLARQHRELAADGLDFQEVSKRGPELSRFPEGKRWSVLASIEKKYLETLDTLNLWDRQEARLFAVRNSECSSNRPVVLIGASDLNQIVRAMLDQVVESTDLAKADAVTALVHASAEHAHLFDAHGCLAVEQWQNRPVPIKDEHVIVVSSAEDQAVGAGLALASLDTKYVSSDVAIGCPDDRLVPPLQRRLAEAAADTRWAVGRSLDQSRVGQLLAAVAEHLDRASTDTTLKLLRHPDVAVLVDLEHRDHVLPQLDLYRSARYPRRLDAKHLIEFPDAEKIASAAVGVSVVENLVASLASGTKRTVGGWGTAIQELLELVYADVEFDLDIPSEAESLSAIDRVSELIAQFDRCPTELDVRVGASDAIRLIVSSLAEQSGRPADNGNAVTLTGWLEMPLDDRPVAIVTSFNDGFIPTAVTSDLFLPGTLRHHLGLNDNERRYARDAYATTALIHSSEVVRLIVAKRDGEGNPLSPSRLLFSSSPTDTVVTYQRLMHQQNEQPELATTWTPRTSTWAVPVPPVAPNVERQISTPVELSVTAFRDYIACPYRFYLKHVLGIRPSEKVDDELSAAAFGSLVHVVLSQFGHGPDKDSADADKIREFVADALATYTKAVFGTQPLPAIQIQIQKAEQRLNMFAEAQAKRTADGWSIWLAETEDENSREVLRCSFADHENVMARLRGRIDRIDRHEDGHWLILDYKTSDTAKKPKSAHFKPRSTGWVDLQLPLYRHLAEPVGVSGDVRTGYFNLPQSGSACGVDVASFTEAELDQADDLARRILANVRHGKFDERSDSVDFDDFASICQSDVLQVAESNADNNLEDNS